MEEIIDYGKLISVTRTERLYDFSNYRKSDILLDDIIKGKIKLNKALDLQSKFK